MNGAEDDYGDSSTNLVIILFYPLLQHGGCKVYLLLIRLHLPSNYCLKSCDRGKLGLAEKVGVQPVNEHLSHSGYWCQLNA